VSRVLVTGANGFIGAHVLAALKWAGCETIGAVRPGSKLLAHPGMSTVAIDMDDANASAWVAALEGVDCVVNTAGAFADGVGQSTRVHDRGVEVLIRACEKAGVRRFIHFSALGVDDRLTSFARTKRAGDQTLMASSLDWIILRPSIVLGGPPAGGSALIRGLAALPYVPVEEAQGPIDAVMLEDVIDTVVVLSTTQTPGHRVLDLAGPERLALQDIIARYRTWLGWRPARRFKAPDWLMGLGYALGDIAGALGWRTPVRTAGRIELKRGAAGDAGLWTATAGIKPSTLEKAFARRPSTLQDRRSAQFYFLKPVIFAITAAFWIGTGIISLTIGYDIGVALLREGGMGALSGPSVIAGGWADILIGLGVLFRPSARLALWAAIAISVFYALAGTLILPRLWEDPIGPMLKIWPILILNVVALFMVRER
jgi:uncharacterized protein YbjT (DUF2867 family)